MIEQGLIDAIAEACARKAVKLMLGAFVVGAVLGATIVWIFL